MHILFVHLLVNAFITQFLLSAGNRQHLKAALVLAARMSEAFYQTKLVALTDKDAECLEGRRSIKIIN